MASGTSSKFDTEVTEPFKRQGSLRKVLPSLPNSDSQLSMSVKMIDRPMVTNRGNLLAYSPYQQEYCTISEYNMLRKQDLPGIYVIPSAQSSLLWFGVIFIRQGLYQGAIFRFNVHLPENFPDGGCPRIIFQSQVYHPMINFDTGEMDVTSGFHEWRKNVNHVWQVLLYLRRVFHKVESSSPLNKEAAELYDADKTMFGDQVQSCVKLSIDHVHDPPATDDPHYITFEHYVEEIHGPIRDAICKSTDEDRCPSSLGLSWVQPGSLEPFSRPSS